MMKLSQLVNSALEDAQEKIASAQDAEKTAGFDDVAKAVGSKARDIAHGSGKGIKAMTEPGVMTRAARKVVSGAQSLGKHLGGTDIHSETGRGIMAGAAGLTAASGAAAAGAKAMHGRHKKDKDEGTEHTASEEVVSTATEAIKFAESLEHLAMLFPKIAEGSHSVNDLAGPPVLVSPGKGPTKDTSTKARTLSPAEASHQGGSGDNMHVETNKKDAPYAAKAAEAILEAKLAQSNALLAAGQAKEAAALAKKAQLEFETAKRAFDEPASTPKGNPQTLPVNRKAGDFPVPGKVPADNKGMIDMTKRQAKTEDVRREAGKHVAEPALSAATDKGLTDNVEHTQGAKIAKVNSIFAKVAARKQAASLTDYLPLAGADTASLDPEVYKQLAHRQALLGGGLLGLEGGVAGGVLGHMAGGGRGAALGALGGTALGALGGYGAGRAGMGLRHAIDKNRQETKGQGVVAGKLERTGPFSAAVHGALMGQGTMATPEEMAARAQGQGQG